MDSMTFLHARFLTLLSVVAGLQWPGDTHPYNKKIRDSNPTAVNNVLNSMLHWSFDQRLPADVLTVAVNQTHLTYTVTDVSIPSFGTNSVVYFFADGAVCEHCSSTLASGSFRLTPGQEWHTIHTYFVAVMNVESLEVYAVNGTCKFGSSSDSLIVVDSGTFASVGCTEDGLSVSFSGDGQWGDATVMVVYFDGRPFLHHAAPNNADTISLSRIITGEHQLSVAILSPHHPSVLALSEPTLVAPCADHPKVAVSFVIPSYQRYKPLQLLLLSLQLQSASEWEAVVVNDGPDETMEQVIAQHFGDDPRIRYDETPARGSVYGHNCREHGVQLARGAWVVHTNDDNYYVPTFVETMMSVAHGNLSLLHYDLIHSYATYKYHRTELAFGAMDMGSIMIVAAVGFPFRNIAADYAYVLRLTHFIPQHRVKHVDFCGYVHNSIASWMPIKRTLQSQDKHEEL